MSTGLFVEMMAQAVMGMLITPGCCNEVSFLGKEPTLEEKQELQV